MSYATKIPRLKMQIAQDRGEARMNHARHEVALATEAKKKREREAEAWIAEVRARKARR